MPRRKARTAPNEPLRLVGYSRVSTLAQATDGVSLDMQRERLEAYARSQGGELIAMETDNGISGSVPPFQRPGLTRALERIRRGEASGLLVFKLDRLSGRCRGHCPAPGRVLARLVARDLPEIS